MKQPLRRSIPLLPGCVLTGAVTLGILSTSRPAFAEPWSGILAPSRAVDWSLTGLPPKLPDGETTPNPWTPPTRTQCGTTLAPLGSGQDDTAQITAAIASCSAAHYVLLGAGTFTINSRLALYGSKSVSLRGSGAQSTKLNMGSAGSIALGLASGGGTATLTSSSNYAQTATSITVSGSQPIVNTPASIMQCDTGMSGPNCATGTEADNGGVWICGDQTLCSNQTANGGHAHEQQMVFVTAVAGTGPYTVTIDPGLYMANWTYAQSPTLSWNDPTYTAIGIGFEDVTVDFTAGTATNNGTFAVNNGYGVWVKGVRFIGPNASSCCTIIISTVGNSLFSNNYIFDTNPLTGLGGGLSFQYGGHSAFLTLNNVFQGGGVNSIEGGGWDSADVLAYNYSRDNNTSQVYNGDAEHSASPNFILREGNQFGMSEDDGTWGTHNFDTWFRNAYSCYDPPYLGEAAPRGIIIDNYARFENAIGNAIGGAGGCTSYQGTATPPYEFGFGSDPLAMSTSMRWGNYDTVTGTVHWTASEVPSSLPSPNSAYSNPVPSDDTLPPSFFMNGLTPHSSGGTGLNWWRVCTSWSTFPTACATSQSPPMPPVGPDVTGGSEAQGHAYDVPAAVAYKNLPIDSTYQNSYTVTGASWSGGTETLTVTGLPSTTGHTMGGFQLQGASAACLPTSGVSSTGRADGEILMTGSSATTISYALASNPGTSCTGTMKWPDVRQFDERVYEVDLGGEDAGVSSDAGESSTGDASTRDASTDGGSTSSGPSKSSGCGCGILGESGSASLAWLGAIGIGVAALGRKRRRR
jgi:hypothetical protein